MQPPPSSPNIDSEIMSRKRKDSQLRCVNMSNNTAITHLRVSDSSSLRDWIAMQMYHPIIRLPNTKNSALTNRLVKTLPTPYFIGAKKSQKKIIRFSKKPQSDNLNRKTPFSFIVGCTPLTTQNRTAFYLRPYILQVKHSQFRQYLDEVPASCSYP